VPALLVILCLILSAEAARAEFPLGFRAGGGLGPGFGTTHNLAPPPFSGLFAADLAWRDHPGHAYVVAFDAWFVGLPMGYLPEQHRLESVEASAVTFGVERSPASPTSNRFIQGSIGVGRLWFDEGGPGSVNSSAVGLALSAQAAFRLVARPGPLGLVVGVRTAHVLTRDGSAHTLTFLLGPTISPIER
jgi:hypothetical protein